MAAGVMLYDADCGFCTRTASRVRRLGVDVDIAAIQETDLAAVGVDTERALREMPFVGADGSVSYGHQAWAGVLMTGSLPLRAVGQALGSRAVAPLAGRVYRWVSENRQRLPGGTPACELDES
jgi:predicted DCC family thiol-disulfide oxidoreductase YuxK